MAIIDYKNFKAKPTRKEVFKDVLEGIAGIICFSLTIYILMAIFYMME